MRLRYLFVVVSPTDENFPVTIPNFLQAAGGGGGGVGYKLLGPIGPLRHDDKRNQQRNLLIKVPKPIFFSALKCLLLKGWGENIGLPLQSRQVCLSRKTSWHERFTAQKSFTVQGATECK